MQVIVVDFCGLACRSEVCWGVLEASLLRDWSGDLNRPQGILVLRGFRERRA